MPSDIASARLEAAKDLAGLSFNILGIVPESGKPIRLIGQTYATNLDDLKLFNKRLSAMGANVFQQGRTKRSG